MTPTPADVVRQDELVEILIEARSFIGMRAPHAVEAKDCRVCQMLERIDAVLPPAVTERATGEEG